MTPLQKRVAAAQATKDQFYGKQFQYGRSDCAQMIRRHLVRMGKPVKEFARAGTYRSLKGGMDALKRAGFKTLPELLDAYFERIPPAAALPGDVVEMPGVMGPGALSVALGNGRVLAYHEDCLGAAVLEPLAFVAAWRIEPQTQRSTAPREK